MHGAKRAEATEYRITNRQLVGVFIGLFVVLGASLALWFLVTRQTRHERNEAGLLRQCQRNLKTLAIALSTYAEVHGALPPAYIADAQGKPLHSWRVLILPFLEQETLYRQYRFVEPWDGPNNRKLTSQMPDVFACPADDEPPAAGRTRYLAVVGPNTAFPGREPRRLADLPDGPTRTLVLVESNLEVNWLEPRDLDFAAISFEIRNSGPPGLGSPHPPGSNAAYLSGRVEVLTDDRPPDYIRSLIDGADDKPGY